MNNDCNHRKSQCDSCKCGISIRTIPAALGDDTGKFKPENGADHNAFWKYEANGAQYFFSKEGIFSKVAELPEYIQKQADWNETDPQSPSYIMNKPDVATVNDIDQEIVMREAEDEHLNDLINGLGDELNDEINARIQADAGLTERLDAIDLTDYVKRTDFPTATTAGVVRDANCFLTSNENGGAYAEEMSYSSYSAASDYNFIGKGTLENVLDARKYLKTLYTLELPATGSEDTLYLTPAEEQPDVEASASGKDINITDASEGDLIDWEIKGDTEQSQYSGKNMYRYVEPGTKNGVSLSRTEDGYIVTGTATARADFYAWEEDITKFENGATYTLSANIPLQNAGVYFEAYNGSTWVRHALGSGAYLSSTKQVITHAIDLTGADRVRFTIRVETGWAPNIKGLKIQLEKGNATDFEPYVGGTPSPNPDYPQAVKTVTGRNTVSVVGKNLIDKTKSVNGNIVANSKSEALTPTNLAITSDWFSVEPNTTYVVGGENNRSRWQFKDKDGNIISNSADANPITTPSNAVLARVYYWYSNSGSVAPTDKNVQVEKGAVPTSYQPYSGQEVELDLGDIELCKLGDYQDRIFKDGSVWKIEKQIGKIAYIGESSEDWRKFEYSDAYVWRATTIPSGMSGSTITSDLFKSDCFTYWVNDGTSVSTALSNGQFGFNAGATNINFKYTGVSELSDWKSWLSENKPVIYYPLAAPTVTTIENQALIDQLNALEALTTQAGINTITTETENLKPFLELTYFRPDPTVTKEEWLWVENHYEQIGGERRYTHNLVVNHSTAQGHWDYAFTIVGKDANHYTQLAQVAYYLFREHAGLSIPVSGTYVEGSNVYILTKITASSLGQVTIEMRKLSDGSLRSISTGAVPVLDTIS